MFNIKDFSLKLGIWWQGVTMGEGLGVVENEHSLTRDLFDDDSVLGFSQDENEMFDSDDLWSTEHFIDNDIVTSDGINPANGLLMSSGDLDIMGNPYGFDS